MKTPLSLEFLEQMEKYAHILTVEKMLYEQRETKQREVTMIIDLSNHECLYEEDIPKEVHRVHVRNIAKSIPNIECCAKVMREATKHWKKHPEQYIAIHCAYGFNRTGFIVCSYLIEKENMTAEESLEAFAIFAASSSRESLSFKSVFRIVIRTEVGVLLLWNFEKRFFVRGARFS